MYSYRQNTKLIFSRGSFVISLFLSVKIDLTTDSRTEYDSLPEKTGCHFFLGHFSTLAGDSKFKFFEILKSNITHEILL